MILLSSAALLADVSKYEVLRAQYSLRPIPPKLPPPASMQSVLSHVFSSLSEPQRRRLRDALYMEHVSIMMSQTFYDTAAHDTSVPLMAQVDVALYQALDQSLDNASADQDAAARASNAADADAAEQASAEQAAPSSSPHVPASHLHWPPRSAHTSLSDDSFHEHFTAALKQLQVRFMYSKLFIP